jgi:hypothetical protein
MVKPLVSAAGFGSALIILFVQLPANAQKFTIALELRGQQVEGTPLAWTDSDVALLRRDGSLLNFSPANARGFRKTAVGFQSYSQGEIRAQLAREFGRKFEVSGTGHYLVVHPAGLRDQWAGRFEQLYRSFVHYFTARGFRLQEPQFPLIAVVFPDHPSFLRYAQQTKERLHPNTLGYYSPTSNRILLYDTTHGRSAGDANWQINAETIIHEAAHQSAFNTSIHNRFAHPPRWVIEGLGTMFEARGVWNSRQYPSFVDRINRSYLADFQRYVATRRAKGSLSRTVSSDRFFQLHPAEAYAEAWALTFFLSETRPVKYTQFLQKTAVRSSFTTYRSPEMLRDFSDSFGADLSMLEAQFVRYMSKLK